MGRVIETPWGGRIPTPREVDDLVARMRRNEIVIYHRGNLERDRDGSDAASESLSQMASRFYNHGTPKAFAWAEERAVDGLDSGRLVQRRIAAFDYEYRFIKS